MIDWLKALPYLGPLLTAVASLFTKTPIPPPPNPDPLTVNSGDDPARKAAAERAAKGSP